MNEDPAETLRKEIRRLELETSTYRQLLASLMHERQETCQHPDERSDPYMRWCDYCGWARERSF